MTIWFIIGTAAELIKVYPVIHEVQHRSIPWKILFTGQSNQNFWMQVQDFEIDKSSIIELLENQQDLKNTRAALGWFMRAFFVGMFGLRKRARKYLAPDFVKDDTLVVHGDTLSTLVGALYGKRLGLRIVHVEAGMRSHCWYAPFPEEISRRIVSRLAHFHMAPDENAQKNLFKEGIKENVLVTGGNTVVDSLQLALETFSKEATPYVLANVHRFENLHSPIRWKKIIDLLIDVSKKHKVIFVLMPPTAELLKNEHQTMKRLLDAGIELKARMPFRQFSKLLNGALFVLSDGGSNQQECHYIGKPCLVLRDVTESVEGIGGACILAKFDEKIINHFLQNYKEFERPNAFPEKRPTDMILGKLLP